MIIRNNIIIKNQFIQYKNTKKNYLKITLTKNGGFI